MILKTYEVVVDKDFTANNYLLIEETSHDAVLIDSTGDFNKIKHDLDENKANLKYILLTHGHYDHIRGCMDFSKNLNTPIFMNKNDLMWIENIKAQCDYFSLPAFEMPPISKYIDENTELKIGTHNIKILELKGHTKGGLGFYVQNMLFSGDTLFKDNVGRCDLIDGSFDEISDSIFDKIYKLPKETIVYPGHGEMTSVEYEYNNNYYVNKNSK